MAGPYAAALINWPLAVTTNVRSPKIVPVGMLTLALWIELASSSMPRPRAAS